jgi:Lipase (class 3)
LHDDSLLCIVGYQTSHSTPLFSKETPMPTYFNTMGVPAPYYSAWKAFFGATMCFLSEQSNTSWQGIITPLIGASSIVSVPVTGFVPGFVVIYTPNYVVLAMQGTSTIGQALAQIAGLGVQPATNCTGSVLKFVDVLSQTMMTWIGANVGAAAPLVLFGHSLGGAVMECLNAKLLRAGLNPISCYTYGSPRMCDFAFFQSNSFAPVWNVRHVLDPVPDQPSSIFSRTINAVTNLTYLPYMYHTGTEHPTGARTWTSSFETLFSWTTPAAALYNASANTWDYHVMQAYIDAIWAELGREGNSQTDYGIQALLASLTASGASGETIRQRL